VNDFITEQYQLKMIKDLGVLKTILRRLHGHILDLLDPSESEGNVATRDEFIVKLGKLLSADAGDSTEGPLSKITFFVTQGFQDWDEVTDFLLGRPSANKHICGHGSTMCLRWLRKHLEETDKSENWSSNGIILEKILSSLIKRAREDALFVTMLGASYNGSEFVFTTNGRPFTCVESEQLCCDAGYRVIMKTIGGRISSCPIGYSRFTQPIFLEHTKPVSDDHMSQAKKRVDAYQKQIPNPHRKHLIGKLPDNVFALPTENIQRAEFVDAYDSGDDALVKAREVREKSKVGCRSVSETTDTATRRKNIRKRRKKPPVKNTGQHKSPPATRKTVKKEKTAIVKPKKPRATSGKTGDPDRRKFKPENEPPSSNDEYEGESEGDAESELEESDLEEYDSDGAFDMTSS